MCRSSKCRASICGCVHERLRWHVYCARSARVHLGEVRVGSSSAKMLTEHIMRFKRPVFDPRDKKRFFWNRNLVMLYMNIHLCAAMEKYSDSKNLSNVWYV